MGKANRVRRQAKVRAKARDEQRRRQRGGGAPRAAGGAGAAGWQAFAGAGQRRTAGPRLPLAARADVLVMEGLHAQFRGDFAAMAGCAAELAAQTSGASWQRASGLALLAALQRAVTVGWHQGWQPAEVSRQVGREFSALHARLAVDMIAAEMRGYAAATVDERWASQLAALDATAWWSADDGYLDEWLEREHLGRLAAVTCALEVLFALATLPGLNQICPLPGTARRGTLAAERSSRQSVDQRMLGRVRGLLAKAESTEFPQEAEALTARAQELMARHSIDEALLAASAGPAGGDGPSARRIFVDNPYEGPKTVLLDNVAKANRCRVVWHKQLAMSSVLGFPADLNSVELLFTSLLVQATTVMLQEGSRRDAYGRSRTRTFRQSFLTSYAQRIGERLTDATGTVERAAAAEAPGTNLLPVLAARHRAVDEAVDDMFPELTHHSMGSANDHEGWITGRAAADLASLHGQREVTGDAA